ncbi:FAD binding domain-containing protein [Cellulomonas dongxiuzhuiae]|uniref:FAD binding domain-containing protein n=1 Tax=Cellulomonas dongxiuzhuiae TaxID=2819979 RepID=A0ABX8GGV6_9CELL|nr:FAD binding domain-containing protein [Cellulomonas dongxiuzhuiae]MBO3094334.1 FAD binding domain-containing protein [Cellulomonas dongxiuzhuiae]QWC15372.1 FAD binding domain-containing protein [Cellulomonas dongxiuzhuiae]
MDLAVTSLRAARTRADLRLAPGERPLAGGTWLFSEPQPGVTGLVDLMSLGWEPVARTAAGLRVAATCTVEQLASHAPDPAWNAWPTVAACVDALLMSFKVQAQATVGGNVALALPAGAMTSLLAGLDAVAVVWTPDGGERREAVADLVVGPGRTTLAPGEVLRAFDVPTHALEARAAVRQIALTAVGRSSSLVVARRDADGTVTLTVTAATPRPVQHRFASPPTSAQVDGVLTGLEWYDDLHGAPDWRRAVTTLLAHEVLAEVAA